MIVIQICGEHRRFVQIPAAPRAALICQIVKKPPHVRRQLLCLPHSERAHASDNGVKVIEHGCSVFWERLK